MDGDGSPGVQAQTVQICISGGNWGTTVYPTKIKPNRHKYRIEQTEETIQKNSPSKNGLERRV